MSKNKLRKIQVADKTFLWKRSHEHLADFKYSKCVERLVIYLKGYKKSPLQLFFREEDNLDIKSDVNKEKWCIGYPDEGVIWLYRNKASSPNNALNTQEQNNTIHINLNRPAVIAKFIRHFVHEDWKPEETSKPLVIRNALKLLEMIELPHGIR